MWVLITRQIDYMYIKRQGQKGRHSTYVAIPQIALIKMIATDGAALPAPSTVAWPFPEAFKMSKNDSGLFLLYTLYLIKCSFKNMTQSALKFELVNQHFINNFHKSCLHSGWVRKCPQICLFDDSLLWRLDDYKGDLISEGFSISKKMCQITILSIFFLFGQCKGQ